MTFKLFNAHPTSTLMVERLYLLSNMYEDISNSTLYHSMVSKLLHVTYIKHILLVLFFVICKIIDSFNFK